MSSSSQPAANIVRSSYKQTAQQLNEDSQLEAEIEGFMLASKLEEADQQDEEILRDDLTEDEENYLTLLEIKLKQTESRIIETQYLVNNMSMRDDIDLAKITKLTGQVDQLTASHQESNTRLIQQNLNEDIRLYALRVQEENSRLLSERDDFELKYTLRNKQIQILLRTIKLHRQEQKESSSVIAQRDKQLKEANRIVAAAPQPHAALLRIQEIEKNKSKNIVQLPKMSASRQPSASYASTAAAIADLDPYDFWSQNTRDPLTKTERKKPVIHQKTLKDVIPNRTLWVVEQESGELKIDGLLSNNTNAERLDVLYNLPYQGNPSTDQQDDGQRQQDYRNNNLQSQRWGNTNQQQQQQSYSNMNQPAHYA